MRAIIASALLIATTAAAQPAPDLQLTIYNDDLALVRDSRQIDLPAGRSVHEFKDVSAKIRPETVTLAAPGASIVEQNFDYDLLSPTAMMEKAIGQQVTIVRTNTGNGQEVRERATVLAVNGGVVLRIGERIEVLRDDGLPVRVIFDAVPPGLRARPTLSVTLDSSRGGARRAVLSYLTPGLGWKADYVARFDEAKGQIDVQGWVTLTNTSGTSYPAADVVLVAGNPGSGGEQVFNPYQRRLRQQGTEGVEQAGTESGTRGRLGDYYLYPLAERTTVAESQTKQVSFLDVRGVPATKAYEYRAEWLQTLDTPASAVTVLRFSNSAKGGLGDQLPAGTVRVYIADARGQAQFIGENPIGHTPMGSAIAIKTGDAFDVKVQPTVVTRAKLGDRRWRSSIDYTVTNARPEPVTVRVAQAGLYFDTRVVSESLKSTRRDADTLEWAVPVPANGKTVLNVTVETRF